MMMVVEEEIGCLSVGKIEAEGYEIELGGKDCPLLSWG
jgi:hypothetical protein